MMIVHAQPPLIDEIDAAFRCRDHPGIMYSWGTKLYVPNAATKVSGALIEHEQVHGERQGSGIEGWWRRYIADPAFRLAEEIPAHQAEWQWHARQPGADRPVMGWRSRKQYHLHYIAQRLAGPLYGGLISHADAKRVIANGRC